MPTPSDTQTELFQLCGLRYTGIGVPAQFLPVVAAHFFDIDLPPPVGPGRQRRDAQGPGTGLKSARIKPLLDVEGLFLGLNPVPDGEIVGRCPLPAGSRIEPLENRQPFDPQ